MEQPQKTAELTEDRYQEARRLLRHVSAALAQVAAENDLPVLAFNIVAVLGEPLREPADGVEGSDVEAYVEASYIASGGPARGLGEAMAHRIDKLMTSVDWSAEPGVNGSTEAGER